jgi:3-dehydroquinate synthase
MKRYTLSPKWEPPSTEILLGQDLFNRPFFQKVQATHPHFLVLCDENVRAWGERIAEGLKTESIPFASGEKAKTRKTLEHLQDKLLALPISRATCLIAVGGGVAMDLIGFLASTLLRGMPLILVPTSLLAMIDASIGGKTGIDTHQGKNLIGSFYPAEKVWIDLDTLKTLPKREWTNGEGELLKLALALDPSLADLPLIEKIERAIKLKIRVVEKDPYDKAERRVLHFGHTFAHALETLSNYEIPHGEAVSLGCLMETYLSDLTQKELDWAVTQVKRLGVKFPEEQSASALFETIQKDKKGGPSILSLEKIGRCRPFDGSYSRPVCLEEVERARAYLLNVL